jgi:hypothetical protein
VAKRLKTKPPRKMALSSAHKLIGEFVTHWNLLEGTLDQAVVTLCKLDPLHGRIITANLHFQTKMRIITTMINLLSVSKSDAWKQAAEETLSTIQKINQEWRTMVVHNMIYPIDMKTVEFMRVSAKKKLHFSDTKRSKEQFRDVHAEIRTAWMGVKKITEDLSHKTTSDLAKALASKQPIAGLGALMAPGPLTLGLWTGPPSGGLFGPLGTAPPKPKDAK